MLILTAVKNTVNNVKVLHAVTVNLIRTRQRRSYMICGKDGTFLVHPHRDNLCHRVSTIFKMAASATFAEDELGRKWDRCLTDVVLKMGNYVCLHFSLTPCCSRKS